MPLDLVRANVVVDVLQERFRQVEVEGFDIEHDTRHIRGELEMAAATYALIDFPAGDVSAQAEGFWPWERRWLKLKGYRRNLVRAAALLLAAIERHDRIEAATEARIAARNSEHTR